jgi:hypothetical protein
VDQLFKRMWLDLERSITKAVQHPKLSSRVRTDTDMLAEVVDRIRTIERVVYKDVGYGPRPWPVPEDDEIEIWATGSRRLGVDLHVALGDLWFAQRSFECPPDGIAAKVMEARFRPGGGAALASSAEALSEVDGVLAYRLTRTFVKQPDSLQDPSEGGGQDEAESDADEDG